MPSGALSADELFGLISSAAPNMSLQDRQTMVAIAFAESGGRVNALNNANNNGSSDFGLWQINSIHGYDQNRLRTDPAYNALAAAQVFAKQGLKAWSVYKNGKYEQFMGQTQGLSGGGGSKAPNSKSPRIAVPGVKAPNFSKQARNMIPTLKAPRFEQLSLAAAKRRDTLKSPRFGADGRGLAAPEDPSSLTAGFGWDQIEDVGVENPFGMGASAFEPGTLKIPSVDEAAAAVDQIFQDYESGYAADTAGALGDSGLTDSQGSGGPKAPKGPMASGTGAVANMITAAKGMLGKPYVWGGTTSAGVDCSGLIYYAFNAAGLNIPRYRAVDYGKRVGFSISEQDARPGDLVYWDNPGDVDHVGIYLGDGQYIQAPTTGDVVKIGGLKWPPTSFRRILPDSAWS